LEYLKSLSPSAIELEFLGLTAGDISNKRLKLMLKFFLKFVTYKTEVDFIQALLNCFLKCHADILIEDSSLT